MLAAIHLTPAAALFQRTMIGKLYGIDPAGSLGMLLSHRAALFLAVVAISVFAAFDPTARRAAALVTGISMIAFLILYARAGMPIGALRRIALVDAAGIVPLVGVSIAAFRA